jgi:hypothetical protein
MKTKILLHLILLSCTSILLTSCSTTNQVVSSFGKRKYMKGYYVNLPSANKGIIASNPIQLLPNKSEAITTMGENILNTALTILTKTKVSSTGLTRTSSSRVNNGNITAPASTILITNTSRAGNAINQSKQKSVQLKNSNNKPEEPQSSNSSSQDGKASLNWLAIAGFILAFLFPLLGIIFSVIGLKSKHHYLALAGLIISCIMIIVGFIVIIDLTVSFFLTSI